MPSEYENNERIVSAHSIAPADGERRAISGYYPQYWGGKCTCRLRKAFLG